MWANSSICISIQNSVDIGCHQAINLHKLGQQNFDSFCNLPSCELSNAYIMEEYGGNLTLSIQYSIQFTDKELRKFASLTSLKKNMIKCNNEKHAAWSNPSSGLSYKNKERSLRIQNPAQF